MAESFIKNPLNKPEVNHKKGWRQGHFLSNLEWVTRAENDAHSCDNGFKKGKRGESHYGCKLSEKQVLEIREKYKKREYTARMLATEYGVSQPHVINIINMKNRPHG